MPFGNQGMAGQALFPEQVGTQVAVAYIRIFAETVNVGRITFEYADVV